MKDVLYLFQQSKLAYLRVVKSLKVEINNHEELNLAAHFKDFTLLLSICCSQRREAQVWGDEIAPSIYHLQNWVKSGLAWHRASGCLFGYSTAFGNLLVPPSKIQFGI